MTSECDLQVSRHESLCKSCRGLQLAEAVYHEDLRRELNFGRYKAWGSSYEVDTTSHNGLASLTTLEYSARTCCCCRYIYEHLKRDAGPDWYLLCQSSKPISVTRDGLFLSAHATKYEDKEYPRADFHARIITSNGKLLLVNGNVLRLTLPKLDLKPSRGLALGPAK